MSRQSWKAREHFGAFLREERAQTPLSHYDLGYILNVSYGTPWEWENGGSFPCNILRLKQLALVFPGVYKELKRIFQLPDVVPSKAEWKTFLRCVEGGIFVPGGNLTVRARNKDVRIDQYKRAFGDYLRESRQAFECTARGLAKGLGMAQGAACIQWEAGLAFPQEITSIILLDRFYGDTLDVIFGICSRHGIHLTREEKRGVFGRLKQFKGTAYRGTGKPRNMAVVEYHRDYRRKKRRSGALPKGTVRALTILEKNGAMTLRGFARAMWPDSECWGKEIARVGPFGPVTGPGQMNTSAGAFLAVRRKEGLVKKVTDNSWKTGKYTISAKGRTKLERAMEAR